MKGVLPLVLSNCDFNSVVQIATLQFGGSICDLKPLLVQLFGLLRPYLIWFLAS